jgi:hypothetical protein
VRQPQEQRHSRRRKSRTAVLEFPESVRSLPSPTGLVAGVALCLTALLHGEPRATARPAPTKTLTGIVRGPTGQPVVGALVGTASGSPGGPQDIATTDASGTFRLERSSPHGGEVYVQGAGFAPTLVDTSAVPEGVPLSIKLEFGATVRGVVTDGRTGQAVMGARIAAVPENAPIATTVCDCDFGNVRALTDSQGQFRLTGLSAGRHTVVASVPGRGLARTVGVQGGSSVELRLVPAPFLSGTVIDPDGRPLADAVVRAISSDPRYESVVEITDHLGRFDLGLPVQGEYSILARHRKFAPGFSTARGVIGDKTAPRMTVAMALGKRIAGRLVSIDRQPLGGSVVVKAIDGHTLPRAMQNAISAVATPNGRFALDWAPRGSLTLGITSRGFVPRDVQVTLDRLDVGLGDIVLNKGRAIVGHVQDSAGAAVHGAQLVAQRDSPFGKGARTVRSVSGRDGSFMLAPLDPGSYTLSVSARGFAPMRKAAQVFDDVDDDVVIALETGGQIDGSIVSEDDTTPESFTVAIDRPTDSGHPDIRTERFTSADGRFVLRDVPAGTYTLNVRSPTGASATVADLKVEPGATTSVGPLRLTDGALLHGQVVDRQQSPIIEASVRAVDSENPGRNLGTGTTNAAGEFVISGLLAPRVDLIATHPRFSPAKVPGVAVGDNDGATVTTIVLGQGGRLEGSVRGRSGKAVPDTAIWLSSLVSNDLPVAPVTPGNDGSFVVEHVPAGRTWVALMSTGGGTQVPLKSRVVEVVEGETVTVDLTSREVLVAGRVTRRDEPLVGARVVLQSQASTPIESPAGGSGAAGAERMTAVTLEDGSYQLIAPEPGVSVVTVSTADGRGRLPARAVQIPDRDAYVLNLDFNTTPVSGVVVDKSTGLPVANATVLAWPKGAKEYSASGITDSRGGFKLDVSASSENEYSIEARASGYGPLESLVSMSESGVADIRLELSPGTSLAGRVLGPTSQPVPGALVFAVANDPNSPRFTRSAADGSFRLDDLAQVPFSIVSGSGTLGYAVRLDATGDDEVLLQLRPAARIEILATDSAGVPVPNAGPRVVAIGGRPVVVPVQGQGSTDSNGRVSMPSPAGVVVIEVHSAMGVGRATVAVSEGEITQVTVTVDPKSRGASR